MGEFLEKKYSYNTLDVNFLFLNYYFLIEKNFVSSKNGCIFALEFKSNSEFRWGISSLG